VPRDCATLASAAASSSRSLPTSLLMPSLGSFAQAEANFYITMPRRSAAGQAIHVVQNNFHRPFRDTRWLLPPLPLLR